MEFPPIADLTLNLFLRAPLPSATPPLGKPLSAFRLHTLWSCLLASGCRPCPPCASLLPPRALVFLPLPILHQPRGAPL
jgi:hypothetical protein